ncbi:MAG: hypothetical protein ABSF23_09390 [Terracidiphilus sp.]
MKMTIAVIAAALRAILLTAAMFTALSMLPANASAQAPQNASSFTIAGHAGEAQLLQVNGKSYVEIETLARLTQGTLSFKANRTILTLPPSDATEQASTPPARPGFSRAFTEAGIEEMGVIREWRIAIVSAVLNNAPVSEDWVSSQHRLSEKNLALASAAASTDDDRSAYPLLSAEFNNMQTLSESYLVIRKQAAFISPDTFHNSPLEDRILSCARDFVSMTENHEFQDLPSCH